MISLVDLKTQYQLLKEKIHDRMEKVLNHGQFIMGPEVLELEQKLAAYTGVKHAISCASGTDALFLALAAYGVRGGQAVFTTDLTFVATAEAIARTGARPVFVDIDPVTKNMNPQELDRQICRIIKEGKFEPKGIIAVNLFGLPADYDAIRAVAEKHHLFLIEDAAQSFGAVYKGRKSGSLGDVSATSFFPGKPLGCYGDGGAVFTSDDALAEKISSIRLHGQGRDKYEAVREGLNSRLDTLQAAVLLPKLDILCSEIEKRNQTALLYNSALAKVVEIPPIFSEIHCAWAQYSFCSPKRDVIRDHLIRKGISSVVYYPIPMHLQPVFLNLGYRAGDFPVTEQTVKSILSIPVHPYLSKEEIRFILDEIKFALNE